MHPAYLRCAVLLVVALLAGAAVAADAPPKVVVTSKPAHSLAAAVLSGIAVPALLVDGAASPHTYAMKPSDALKVNAADVFVRISEALEPFTAKVVRALPARVETVTLAEAPGVSLLPRRAGGMFETHAHGGKDHDHARHAAGSTDSHDPHIWLDPANAKAMAAAIAAVLARKAPDLAPRIATNLAALHARIDATAAEVAATLRPVAARPFIVFHDATQYFEHRFGLAAVGSITVSPDVQPSAKRLSDLRGKLLSLSAVCVFSEPGFERRIIASVTEGTRARTGVLDPEGLSLTAGAELYPALIAGLARDVRACLDDPAATATGISAPAR